MSERGSVQDVVRIIVTRNPYLYRGLRMRVINYSAVARYIQGEVETAFGDQVDPNTIVTAVMRLSNKEITEEEPESLLAGSRLNLVTGISEVTVAAPPTKHGEIVGRILGSGAFEGGLLSLHQFGDRLRLMTNSSDAGRIGAELGEYAVSVSPGYAELHIRLPRGFEELQSGTTTIIDALAQNGVYAVDAFFASTDVGLFVREEEASRAFEVLRALIR